MSEWRTSLGSSAVNLADVPVAIFDRDADTSNPPYYRPAQRVEVSPDGRMAALRWYTKDDPPAWPAAGCTLPRWDYAPLDVDNSALWALVQDLVIGAVCSPFLNTGKAGVV